MKSYPLQGVTVSRVNKVRDVSNLSYTGLDFTVSQTEYRMTASEVGDFYAANGNLVEFSPDPGADPGWVKLYLNGQVLVALLHQRNIISFHASSFIHLSRGVMILGETGAGKSSLTVAFALEGAGFLSDDLTPVIFKDAVPHIWPLPRAVKLRESTVGQLNIGDNRLTEAEAGTGKQYLHLQHAGEPDYHLGVILKIEVGSVPAPEFHELSPSEKFSLLRSEICSWEILAGMPETEAAYLTQLVQIVENVHFMRVVRPEKIRIGEMYEATEKLLRQI